jgi:hypothetical protein
MPRRRQVNDPASSSGTSAPKKRKKKKEGPKECLPGLDQLMTVTKPKYYFAGIDPGKSGGFSLLFPDGKAVSYPTPMIKASGGNRYNTKSMFSLLCMLHKLRSTGGAVRVFIETQQGRPDTSKWSTQTIGEGFGRWLSLIELLELPVEVINPSAWKPYYVPSKAHKWASVMASNVIYHTDLKNSQDGQAEAVLIADYGKRKLFGWL